MNALEFLIANADAVRKVWEEHVVGRTMLPRYQTPDSRKGNTFKDASDAWLVVNAYSKGAVYVHIVHKDVLLSAELSDFINGATVSDKPTTREKALTIARLASVHSIRLPRKSTKVTRECVSLKVSTFLSILSNVRNLFPSGSAGYVLYECPAYIHKLQRAYKIRKSVLLKEAGGSTAKEGNVSLAEPRKNSFRASYFLSKNYATEEAIRRVVDKYNATRPACIRIPIRKPGMQDGEYSRRIRIHGTAKITHFTPEQIEASQNKNSKSATEWAALLSKWSSGTRWAAAPYGKMAEELKDARYASAADQAPTTVKEVIDHANKQYSEEHAKQLASLDALIASPSMPDACKTLLRGCRHQFERADTYDQLGGERSMDKIVPMFNILYGKDLTKEQGWMFMMLVKAVRSANGNYSADSYEDGGSYWGLADEDAKKERK